jgi:hypothetical protein
MTSDPLELALREISDTRRLLDALITSSESFDYVRAKATLEELRLKARVLAGIEAELTGRRGPAQNHIIPFPFTERVG